MANELRKTGISVVGDIPWGTHFSLLCETTQDFLDTLVPYFKTGLENNEFCIWVVSERLTQQAATDALGQAMPDFDRYLAQRSIEILSHDEWYLQQGIFDVHNVITGWEEKLDQVLARGYAGLRGIGDEGWLTEQYWKDFAQYEKELDKWMAHKRMIALCTYPLAAMSGLRVFDVANSHQFVMARRHGSWQVLETPELIRAKTEIQRLNEELEQRVVERTRELAATNEELIREIAERKHAEHAVHESEKLLRLVLATLPVGVIVTDRAGDIMLANAASTGIWGGMITSGKERWVQTKAFWHDSGQRIGPTEWASVRALSEGQTSLNELIDIETYDGQQKTIHNSVVPIRDAEGQIVGAVIVNEDITERKRAEEAIRKSEQVLREAESLGHTGSWEQNLVTGEIFSTEENLRLFFGDDHSKGKLFEDYAQTVHPNDREFLMQRHAQLLAEGGPRDIEYRVVWPDGSVHVIFGRATVVRDESGEALRVYGTNVDITERKQAEEQIRQYATRLQTLSKQLLVAQEAERRAIARELHDEIGQQLTALGLILSSEHPSPDQLSHADAIVRDLMDRLHDLSLDLRPTILDDMGLIPALVWLFERYTALTGVRVRFEHSGLEEQRFESELETTAYRIIQEALTNVARHADVRDVTVRLWTDDDATLSVMIVDVGRGFDPQMIDTRATSGLAGMQERVGLLGGDVTIESADGEGTRLTVILPLHSDSGLPGEEQSL